MKQYNRNDSILNLVRMPESNFVFRKLHRKLKAADAIKSSRGKVIRNKLILTATIKQRIQTLL
jgi:hypothetical protein